MNRLRSAFQLLFDTPHAVLATFDWAPREGVSGSVRCGEALRHCLASVFFLHIDRGLAICACVDCL